MGKNMSKLTITQKDLDKSFDCFRINFRNNVVDTLREKKLFLSDSGKGSFENMSGRIFNIIHDNGEFGDQQLVLPDPKRQSPSLREVIQEIAAQNMPHPERLLTGQIKQSLEVSERLYKKQIRPDNMKVIVDTFTELSDRLGELVKHAKDGKELPVDPISAEISRNGNGNGHVAAQDSRPSSWARGHQ